MYHQATLQSIPLSELSGDRQDSQAAIITGRKEGTFLDETEKLVADILRDDLHRKNYSALLRDKVAGRINIFNAARNKEIAALKNDLKNARSSASKWQTDYRKLEVECINLRLAAKQNEQTPQDPLVTKAFAKAKEIQGRPHIGIIQGGKHG